MTDTTEYYLSCAETAKLLRQALKATFPGCKFSVRSDTYSGGASIDVHWTDGPTDGDVDAICQLYRGATFDGMQDLKEYHSTLLAGPDGDVRHVHFGADFVFTNRTLSDGYIARYLPGVRQHGHTATNGLQLCDGCGNHLRADAACWVGRTIRFGSPWIAFCCSAICAAKTEARANVEPAPAVQLGDVVAAVGRVTLPRPLRIAKAWSELAGHRTVLVDIDGRHVGYYASDERQPVVAEAPTL